MGKTIEGAYDAHRRTIKDKVHRRDVRLGSRAFSVLSLRPSTRHRYAMNRYHETWHILCNAGSAHYLGRLLWALSFQKWPNTVLVIDGESIVPTPFDGEPSPSFAFLNQATTALSKAQSQQLTRELPLHGGHRSRPSDGTVVMHSQSRPAAVRGETDRWAPQTGSQPAWACGRGSVRLERGVVFFALPPTSLRAMSLACDGFDDIERPIDALFFGPYANGTFYPEGEIQTIANFGPKVDAVGRRRSALFGDRTDLTEMERIRLW